MTSRATVVLLQPVAVVGAVLATFAVANDAFRQAEATAAAGLLYLTGVTAERVQILPNSTLAVFPAAQGPFLAVLSPSCSALSSVLAVLFLAAFVPRSARRRRLPALVCALVCVVAGNLLRIAGSIAVGLQSGTASLVLFHDWVGSLFGFGYTVGGFVLMLWLLLPRRPRPDRAPEPDRALAGAGGQTGGF